MQLVEHTMGRQIPAPTRARLCGTLDMIRASDGAFELLLDSGERAHGLWMPADGNVLSRFWSKRVLLEGTAHFKPSSVFLRLEADVIRQAEDSDALFAVLPAAIGTTPPRLYVPARHAKLAVRDAWVGQWPGEETEEQLLAALREARA